MSVAAAERNDSGDERKDCGECNSICQCEAPFNAIDRITQRLQLCALRILESCRRYAFLLMQLREARFLSVIKCRKPPFEEADLFAARLAFAHIFRGEHLDLHFRLLTQCFQPLECPPVLPAGTQVEQLFISAEILRAIVQECRVIRDSACVFTGLNAIRCIDA